LSRPVGRTELRNALLEYHPWDQTEAAHRDNIIRFIAAEEACFERSLSKGHITGSAWIINHAGTHAALVLHRKLNRWLQPGGHADGNTDIFLVAHREAEEETGIQGLVSNEEIFDVDVHMIPANTKEAAHYHYDSRYLFRASADALLHSSHESHDVQWISADSIKKYIGNEASILRMKDKWLSAKQKAGAQTR